MNELEQILAILGKMTDEQKEVIATALTTKTDASEAPAVEEVNPYINDDFIIDEDFGKVRSVSIADVNKAIKTTNKNRRTGVFLGGKKPATSKYGIEVQVDKDGNEFNYFRNEFDGEPTKLDEEHEILKQDLMKFKDGVKTLVRNFDGAGSIALTMYQPDIAKEFGFKDGKVFYRWSGQRTAGMLDELRPYIEEAKKMAQEAKEEGQ